VKKINKKICSESEGNLVVKESCALAALTGCPNLIRYFGCWIDDGHLHIQTEYCNKGSLDRFITPYGGILDTKIPGFSSAPVLDDLVTSGVARERTGLDVESVEYRMSSINDDDVFSDDDDENNDENGGVRGDIDRENCLRQCNAASLQANMSIGTVKGGRQGGVGKETDSTHDMGDEYDQNGFIDSDKENTMEIKSENIKQFQNRDDNTDIEKEKENENENENITSPEAGIAVEISENSNSHSFESANYQLKFAEAMQNLGEDSRTSDSYSCFSENNSGNGFKENTNSLKFTDMKYFAAKDLLNNETNTNDCDMKYSLNDPNCVDINHDNNNKCTKNNITMTIPITMNSKELEIGTVSESLAWGVLHSMGNALQYMHGKGTHYLCMFNILVILNFQ
jgi:hypothetical protein